MKLEQIQDLIKLRILKEDSYDATLEKIQQITRELGFYHDVTHSSTAEFSKCFGQNPMNPQKTEAHYFEQELFGFYRATQDVKSKYKENIIAYKLFEILKQKRR